MKLTMTFAVLACAVSISGCAAIANRNEARVLSMSADGVTLRYKEGYLSNAQAMAATMCQEQGKTARLDRVTPADSTNRVASFSCI